jgi:hypothetical protein
MAKEAIIRKWTFGDTIVEERYCSIIGYTYHYYSKKWDKWFSSQHLLVSETQINKEAEIKKIIDDVAEEREKDLLDKYNNELNM